MTQHSLPPASDTVLFQPPFFRCFGSHNDRPQISLVYLSAYLKDAGISHVAYNGDHTSAESYWDIRYLFGNYPLYTEAVDGRSSLYGELTELLLGLAPKTVIILGGEPLVPSKDLGNPFIAAHFSRRLRARGIYTIGVGPFFTLQPEKFEHDFDCLLIGEPSTTIVDIVNEQPRGRVQGKRMDLTCMPCFDHLFPAGQKLDGAMTTLGCFYKCQFCVTGELYRTLGGSIREMDCDTVARDIRRRKDDSIYLMDLNFLVVRNARLDSLANAFRSHGVNKSFSIDCRVDAILEPGRIERLQELNIKTVKLGVESMSAESLAEYNKNITPEEVEAAFVMLRKAGIKIVAYLLLGGHTPVNHDATIAYIRSLAPDFVIPNIWGYDLNSDYRYDTQFSPLRLKEFGIPDDVYFRYLDLQDDLNPTVGKLIESG